MSSPDKCIYLDSADKLILSWAWHRSAHAFSIVLLETQLHHIFGCTRHVELF
jgi:hypothetical protein